MGWGEVPEEAPRKLRARFTNVPGSLGTCAYCDARLMRRGLYIPETEHEFESAMYCSESCIDAMEHFDELMENPHA